MVPLFTRLSVRYSTQEPNIVEGWSLVKSIAENMRRKLEIDEGG